MATRLMQLNLGIVSILLILLGLGCASRGAVPAPNLPKPAEAHGKVKTLELDHLVVTRQDVASISKIHARGMRRLENGAFQEALQDFELCIRAEPAGELVSSALYHSALALDALGRFEAALARFLEAGERSSDDDFGRAASWRALRVACHLERWQTAQFLAERLLTLHQDTRPIETILAQGALALEAAFRGDDVAAELHVARARNVIDSHRLDAPGKILRDVAAVYFALGETRRLRADRIALVPPGSDFLERLEQRCELILLAQAAYSDAMRAYDAHWSTMAGYRIGELYASLHEELMRIVPPSGVMRASQRDLFEGAMRLRYSVLVQKALNLMTHTLSMAERNSEESEWVTRARVARQELERRLRTEQAAIDRLPYSRQSLEYALSAIEQAAAKQRQAGVGTD